jgi:hypothetical protein
MLRVSVVQGYERFLELPVPIVLVVLWTAGVLLQVLCIIELYALYWNGMVLVRLLEGNL